MKFREKDASPHLCKAKIARSVGIVEVNGVRNDPETLSMKHENIVVDNIALKPILLVQMYEEVPNLHEVNPHVVVQGLSTGGRITSIKFTCGVPKIAAPQDKIIGAESNVVVVYSVKTWTPVKAPCKLLGDLKDSFTIVVVGTSKI